MKTIVLFLCALLVGTAGFADDTAGYPKLVSNPEVSTFASLVKKAGLWDFFQGTGPFTVFVPNNAAFSKMDQKKLEELQKPENSDKLVNLINYHIILGAYPLTNLKTQQYRTVYGDDIDVQVTDTLITVNGAKVLTADIIGPNGVGYIIDRVLVP